MNVARVDNQVRSLVLRVIVTSTIISALIAVAFGVVSGPNAAISPLAGAAVAIASFFVLVFTVTMSVDDDGRGRYAKGFVIALGFVKLGVIGVLIWWLVSRNMIDPITFLAGFSSVVVALMIEGMRMKGRS